MIYFVNESATDKAETSTGVHKHVGWDVVYETFGMQQGGDRHGCGNLGGIEQIAMASNTVGHCGYRRALIVRHGFR